MRDLEDIILRTMCINLSEITGIPTGLVLAKMPDIEFVNKYDGSSQPSVNPQKFPCIGMQYAGEVDYMVNKYGEEPLAIKNAGFSKIYEPMGELHIPLYIHLFTNSRKEQREIGNAIMFEMASKLYYNTINDELPNQYFSIEYNGFKDLDRQRPFERVFMVTLCGQVFKETSGYLVETTIVNINAKAGNPYTITEPEQITDSIYLGEIINPEDIYTPITNEGYDLLLIPIEEDT